MGHGRLRAQGAARRLLQRVPSRALDQEIHQGVARPTPFPGPTTSPRPSPPPPRRCSALKYLGWGGRSKEFPRTHAGRWAIWGEIKELEEKEEIESWKDLGGGLQDPWMGTPQSPLGSFCRILWGEGHQGNN